MSLLIAAHRLKDYNKKKLTGQKTETKTPLASVSYANIYDALYDKYSNDPNFNIDAWHESIKRGELDSYIALLEQNKGQKKSDMFYDPSYYNYESNILELYSPFADTKNKEERFREVLDPVTNKYIKESLGEMTEQEYIQYQINQANIARTEMLQRELEQYRKDTMKWLAKSGNTLLAIAAEFREGIVSSLAGIFDFVVASRGLHTGRAIAFAAQGGNWLDNYVEYLGEKGLTALEKKTLRASLDEWERTHTWIRDIDGNMTTPGKYMSGIANSIGMMTPAILANAIAPGSGMPLFYASIYTNNIFENHNNPATANSPSWLKVTNAAINTAVEVIIEYSLDAIFGGTITNQLLGLTGRKAVFKGITKASGIKYIAKSAFQEGLEEFLQDFSTNLVNQFTGMIYEGYGNTGVNIQTLIDSFIIGALSSIVMSGGAIARNSISNKIAQKTDGKIGKANPLIEIDGKPTELKGAKRLAWEATMSEFMNAVETLRKGKININKHLDLAREVYTGVTTMAQFYQSFSLERIKNAEKLLQRVAKIEQKTEQKQKLKSFGDTIYNEINDMIGGVQTRYVKKLLNKELKDALNKVSNKLEEGNVTEVISVTDPDGNVIKKDPAITELEKKIQGKYDKLSKDYDWLFTTDGNVAVEVDDKLFVPIGWLENYEVSEIYKFLAQEQIIDGMLKEKSLQPLLKEAVKHNKQFTKNKNVTAERALMDLLFNETVYQHFLLSNKGKNLMLFKDFIFRLYNMVELLGKRNKLTDERKAYLKQILEQIKETHRVPTMKAIINWNMNPQLIGADIILRKADKEFLNLYQSRKKVKNSILTEKKISSEYKALKKDILEKAWLTDAEKALIEEGSSPDAPIDKQVMALCLLDLADEDNFIPAAQNSEASFVMPIQAVSNEPEVFQFKADVLNSFEKEYGISAQEAFLIDINKLPLFTQKKILDEMKVLKVQDMASFVISKLENMLGGDYIVTPTYKVQNRKLNKKVKNTYNKLLLDFEKISSILIDITTYNKSQVKNLHLYLQKIATHYKLAFLDDYIKKLWDKISTSKIEAKKFVNDTKDELVANLKPIYEEVENRAKLEDDYNEAIDTPSIKDFEIVKKIPGSQLMDDYYFDDTVPLEERNSVFLSLFEEEDYVDEFRTFTLKDFLKLEPNGSPEIQRILDWKVTMDPYLLEHGITVEAKKTIYINTADYVNYIDTFIHEVNHVIQYEYGFTRGFNPQIAYRMPQFLDYILQNYTELVAYQLRRSDFVEDANLLLKEKSSGKVDWSKERNVNRGDLERICAYIGYRLVQGELWAESYMHNGKLIRSFIMAQAESGRTYLISPDGKHKFLIPVKATENLKLPTRKIKPNKMLIENAMVRQFKKILELRDEGDTSNKFQSRLTRKSAFELIQNIINQGLALDIQSRVTLNDIILDPQTYLSQEILDLVQEKYGRIDEGTVYYTLKQWFENNIDGVSLDRDGVTHEYLFVDDNAFDDLLTFELSKKVNDDYNYDLVEKYSSEEGVPLNRLYNMLKLSKLGLPSQIKVIINDKVKTETIIDKEHPNGLITIRADVFTTNAELINKLNHEFRHLMQYYAGLETGFTPDFVVTEKMLNDLKKHVPELFTDPEIKKWAERHKREIDKNLNVENFIAQRFIYYMVGGEQNAYGFKSKWLNTKPFFVDIEAGKPTIFMSWYDANTGEGRYETSFLASRTDDDLNFKKKSTPKLVKREPKYEEKIDTGKKDKDGNPIYKYKYKNNRHFTKAEAEGTNLVYFWNKGIDQMDPDLKDFIKATTGKEKNLPKPLVYAIKQANLTKEKFYEWFRNEDAMNDFTFNLVNKYMFKNEVIRNIEELDNLLGLGTSRLGKGGIAYWWAVSIVLMKHGISEESLLTQNNVDKFLDILSSLENSQWAKEIEKEMNNFNWYYVEGKDGKLKRVNIGLDDSTSNYMRVFAMQWFDGSLAGAFYTARTLRRIVRLYQNKDGLVRLDKNIGDDGDTSLQDIIVDDGLTPDTKKYGNDIIAAYEGEVLYKSSDDMIAEIIQAARPIYEREIEKRAKAKSLKLTEKQFNYLVNQKLLEFGKKLLEMSIDEISARYEQVLMAQMVGGKLRADITEIKPMVKERVNIVNRIKRLGTRIVNLARDGKLVWNDLSKEVRDMFEVTVEETKDGKKVEVRRLKPEVYYVGKGGPKKQDISNILKNEKLLLEEKRKAVKRVKALKDTSKEINNYIRELEKTKKKLKKTREELAEAKEYIKTEFNVKKETSNKKSTKKIARVSETPSHFEIISPIPMPEIVRSLFDVYFEETANTEVQFASVDKDGNILDRETMGDKFDAALQHEVSNWDAYYEAVRNQLLKLTRTDVLDIVEFIQKGMHTFDGPVNKIYAFQIFTLGYILAGARKNVNNWNLSDAEVEMIRKLYESKASGYGSGLNAVGQMLKVIDPLKKVRQRMLDNYGITEAEIEPLLKSVDDLQTEKDASKRVEKAKEVSRLLADIEKKMVQRNKKKKTIYEKIKAFRYSSMLSGPTTWIRNLVGDVVLYILNKASDFLGKFVFSTMGKKAYREGQWDLAGTKTSDAVKTFIEQNIKNSELFNMLYDPTTKFDNRQAKILDEQRGLFVTMIVSALERKYAAENRFDSKTMNRWAIFINKMISDKLFVKKATNEYLGKILTIEVENGNIDLSEGLTEKVLNLFAEAVLLANFDYMRKRSFMADMMDSLKDKHPFAYEVLSWWQPFLNSSFNWFLETIKYNPIGLAVSIYKFAKVEKQIEKIELQRNGKGKPNQLIYSPKAVEALLRRDIGKGIIGVFLLGLGIILYAAGFIKIDEEEEKFLMSVGNIKIDISNIFGTSSLLIGVSIAQMGSQSPDKMMQYIGEAFFEGFLLKDMMDRHRFNQNIWEGLLSETESVLRSFVPQLVQLIISASNNEKIKYTPGFAGVWERWLNSWVPTQPFGDRRINPYTGEVETKWAIPFVGELFRRGIFGPRIFWTKVDEIELFCREYGVNKVELTGEITINGKKKQLDKEQLNLKYGELNKKSLKEIQTQRHNVQMDDGTFATLHWSQLNDKQKARVIDRTMIENANLAKIYIWTQMGHKYYASNDIWEKLRRIGAKNVYKGEKGFVE